MYVSNVEEKYKIREKKLRKVDTSHKEKRAAAQFYGRNGDR